MSDIVFKRTPVLFDRTMHYCPGCTHGIIHRLVAESIDELNIQDRTIGISPVGCAVFAYDYFDCDMYEAAHGRAPAVATGIKRALPDSVVFTYQGDGDLASIGCGEINNAAARGENITVIYVNNAIYGMTGGQMAPTTLIGQRTTTSPLGRNAEHSGYPILVCEMLAPQRGTNYAERVSVHDPAHVRKAKKAIKKAFQYQAEGVSGLNIVEILSSCPTNWGMDSVESLGFIKDKMTEAFPLGMYCDRGGA